MTGIKIQVIEGGIEDEFGEELFSLGMIHQCSMTIWVRGSKFGNVSNQAHEIKLRIGNHGGIVNVLGDGMEVRLSRASSTRMSMTEEGVVSDKIRAVMSSCLISS